VFSLGFGGWRVAVSGSLTAQDDTPGTAQIQVVHNWFEEFGTK